jgi:ABC-type antimicrobial peptide transport system permease subunit
MKPRDLRLAWRLLAKEPAYSAVAILGLAVALAACFLLTGLVRYAWTYNAAVQDARRIVVVKERRNLFPRPDWGESAPPPLAAAAVRQGLAEAATSARSIDLGARVGNRFFKISPSVVDPNYLAFFGVPTIAGDAAAALARPDALVLGRREALRLFGTPDAVGKVLNIAGRPYVVRAIVVDLPENTSPAFDLLLGKGVRDWDPLPATDQQAWFRRVRLYLKPAPGVDADRLGAALEHIVATERDARLPPGLTEGEIKPLTSIAVTPLSKVFFDPGLLASLEGERYGSPAAIAGLALLAVLILLLAASNYVNLAAVRTAARRREIAVRKALGVTAAGPARQFLGQALLVGASSTLIGAVLAWLAIPLFSDLVGRPLASNYDAPAWLLLAAAGVGTSVLAGAYPAWLAARVPASVALGGRAGDLRYTTLRERPGPIMYQLDEEQPVQVVRVRRTGPAALAAARADIEALWARHFPNDAPDIETASAVFARNYRDDMRQARLLALASVVATSLACFGIYVLSSYTVRRRAREIVLRKLHGATPRHIGLLVAREWLLLLALGAGLALAPAWLWSERYLSGFVERAPMGQWPLALAFGLVALIALLACARQAVTAMRMAPVLALRDQ